MVKKILMIILICSVLGFVANYQSELKQKANKLCEKIKSQLPTGNGTFVLVDKKFYVKNWIYKDTPWVNNDNFNPPPQTQSDIINAIGGIIKIIEIDGCEYIYYRSDGLRSHHQGSISHKGNCKNCEERKNKKSMKPRLIDNL